MHLFVVQLFMKSRKWCAVAFSDDRERISFPCRLPTVDWTSKPTSTKGSSQRIKHGIRLWNKFDNFISGRFKNLLRTAIHRWKLHERLCYWNVMLCAIRNEDWNLEKFQNDAVSQSPFRTTVLARENSRVKFLPSGDFYTVVSPQFPVRWELLLTNSLRRIVEWVNRINIFART